MAGRWKEDGEKIPLFYWGFYLSPLFLSFFPSVSVFSLLLPLLAPPYRGTLEIRKEAPRKRDFGQCFRGFSYVHFFPGSCPSWGWPGGAVVNVVSTSFSTGKGPFDIRRKTVFLGGASGRGITAITRAFWGGGLALVTMVFEWFFGGMGWPLCTTVLNGVSGGRLGH